MKDEIKAIAIDKWELELEGKPDFDMAMKRIYAWYDGDIIDRAPIRFTSHNSFVSEKHRNKLFTNVKDKWFDVGFQIECFIDSIREKKFLGETFPVYWPNLGPNVYAAFYGCILEYAEVTSWAKPCIHEWQDLAGLEFKKENEYFSKIVELTNAALEVCNGRFMVGYTDLHPGLDCVAAWRDSQELCFDLYDNPREVKAAIDKATNEFQRVFDYFDLLLKSKRQLSVSWMEIPSFGKMHIPSCDFTAMISEAQFEEFYLPELQAEVKPMTHNIFHLDGKDVARHLDKILEVPEIQAVQWVQGVGGDKPIMQWIPLIKKIQSKGKSVVVDLEADELEEFISVVGPQGIFLCMPVKDEDSQKQILKRLQKWT